MNTTHNALIQCFISLLFLAGCNSESHKQESQKRDSYRYVADLMNLTNDRANITLYPPNLDKDSLEFVFAVSEPAYYNDDLNHGKLVSEMKVYDVQDRLLRIDRTAPNRWTIYNTKNMHRITYEVDDIWEDRDSLSSWLSAENIFENGKVLQLSPNATFGYIDGHDRTNFEVIIKSPAELYRSSGLALPILNVGTDTVRASNFMELADNPFLFTDKEPKRFYVGKTLIEVGVHSGQDKVRPDWVATQIKPVMEAISNYFGGRLPVEKYAFLIYFYPGPIFAATASEHNTSSLWVLPEDWDEGIMGESMASNIRNTAMHEFLHIYAPLTIHSEEKLYFDFDRPEMSKHLWLYEGTTTYMQELIKLNQGLTSEEDFIGYINSIIEEMQDYRTDVSLLEISEETYGRLDDQYDNVELRGFLVNLILDLTLRERSNGTYGLKNLVLDLSQKFGKHRAFKDDDLFAIITDITQTPELDAFFSSYVAGTEPLPLEEIFEKVGYEYNARSLSIRKVKELRPEQKALQDSWLSH